MTDEFDIDGFVKNLKLFEDTLYYAVEITHDIGNIDGIVPHYLLQTQQLFTKLTVTSISIVHLMPKNSIFPSNIEFWDFFSVASLARNLIENYIMFFYVGIDDISDTERDFRLALLRFHLNNEKYKLYKSLGVDDLHEFEEGIPLSKEGLKSHEFVSSIEPNKIERILSGSKASYLERAEILDRIPFDTSDISPLYRLFSNHIHSTPLSFNTISDERGRGEQNEAEVGYSSFILSTCNKYLSMAVVGIVEAFESYLTDFNYVRFCNFKNNIEI